MHIPTLLKKNQNFGLNHKYHLEGHWDDEGFAGYALYCGGNFVFFDPDFDQVLERYTRMATRNSNS